MDGSTDRNEFCGLGGGDVDCLRYLLTSLLDFAPLFGTGALDRAIGPHRSPGLPVDLALPRLNIAWCGGVFTRSHDLLLTSWFQPTWTSVKPELHPAALAGGRRG